MPDMERLRAFALAKRRKADADAVSKEEGKKIAELEPAILEEFANEGVPKITVDVEPARPTLADRLNEVPTLPNALIEWIEDVDLDVFAQLIDDARTLIEENEQKPFSMTLSVGSRIWAKPKVDDPERDKANDAEYQRACRALEAQGFGDYVQERFNVISLSSAMKEEVEEGRLQVGENFDGTIVIEEKFQVNARKAASKSSPPGKYLPEGREEGE